MSHPRRALRFHCSILWYETSHRRTPLAPSQSVALGRLPQRRRRHGDSNGQTRDKDSSAARRALNASSTEPIQIHESDKESGRIIVTE